MTITLDDFEVFCRRSFDGVLAVVDRLGDELINQHPPHTGGSTPYALVTHISGRVRMVGRAHGGRRRIASGARSDEFAASGSVAELHAAVADWLAAAH